MRAVAAALLSGLALAAAGCGGSGTASGGGDLGREAAQLVPPGALAFVSVDTNLDSQQWNRLDELTSQLPARARVLEQLRKALTKEGLDLDRDVRPALGDELDVAVLGIEDDEPEVIALAQPEDEQKLKTLAAKLSKGSEHYTVQRIGDWSVVADSQAAFDAVRTAQSGRSLADTERFRQASAALSGEALATAYVDSASAQRLPKQLAALTRTAGSPRWLGLKVTTDDHAAQVWLSAGAADFALQAYRPDLLRNVPSGAILAVSFKDLDRPLARVATEPTFSDLLDELEEYLGLDAADLSRALRGEGVFYVLPGGLVPIFALELRSPEPQQAAAAFRTIAAKLREKTKNALPLQVVVRGNLVVLTDSLAGVSTGGHSLVDDQPYKDALKAAGVPDRVTVLAYADLHQLVPLIQLLGQLVGGSSQTPAQTDGLDRLGTLVVFGERSGTTSRLSARLTVR